MPLINVRTSFAAEAYILAMTNYTNHNSFGFREVFHGFKLLAEKEVTVASTHERELLRTSRRKAE